MASMCAELPQPGLPEAKTHDLDDRSTRQTIRTTVRTGNFEFERRNALVQKIHHGTLRHGSHGDVKPVFFRNEGMRKIDTPRVFLPGSRKQVRGLAYVRDDGAMDLKGRTFHLQSILASLAWRKHQQEARA
jgi:hypothetical protein